MNDLQKFSQDADKWVPRIASLMMADEAKALRFILMVKNAVAANEYLLRCDASSLFLAVCNAAQTGLEPDPQLGMVYLVPRRGKVYCQLGYRGLLALAYRSERVISAAAGVVRDGDVFEYSLGTDPRIHHVQSAEFKAKFVRVWSAASLIGGVKAADVMPIEAVNVIRDRCSESAKGDKPQFSPWTTSYEAMAMKTVLRRMFKLQPVSTEMLRAISIDEQSELEEIEANKVGAVQKLKASITPQAAIECDTINETVSPIPAVEVPATIPEGAKAAEKLTSPANQQPPSRKKKEPAKSADGFKGRVESVISIPNGKWRANMETGHQMYTANEHHKNYLIKSAADGVDVSLTFSVVDGRAMILSIEGVV